MMSYAALVKMFERVGNRVCASLHTHRFVYMYIKHIYIFVSLLLSALVLACIKVQVTKECPVPSVAKEDWWPLIIIAAIGT